MHINFHFSLGTDYDGRFDNLKACLVHVSDTGRYAFLEAEKKMDLISRTSHLISDNVRCYF